MPYAAFRRQAVPQEYAQQLQTVVLPAPTRGIVMNENVAYMLPGGAIIQDNWFPTLRGCKLRGGTERWTDLHALDATVPPIPDPSRLPVVSAFEYSDGSNQKMFAANAAKLFDVTAPDVPTLIKSGQTSGNYSAAQLANAGDNWMIVVNETGDAPLRYDGTTWEVLVPGYVPPVGKPSTITGPVGTPVEHGLGLSYVWKYRNRLFFIGAGTMDAWYLGLDSVGGALNQIPLAGAATKGGKLLFGATWSLDTGSGLDDKCVFVTDQGEVLIFTGGNPANISDWRQEGRYALSPPLGMNAHISVGGDLLLLTVDGIIPLSQAITKEAGQLDLALLTRTIESIWHEAVIIGRQFPWTIEKWDEESGLFVTTPGGTPGNQFCLVANNTTGAWCRYVGYDATCFVRMRADMFYGTQDGTLMQCERTGFDDGKPYLATLVVGWEMFGTPANEVVWRQARASFRSGSGEPFQPQLSATVDYIVTIPPPPLIGPDPGTQDAWDEGKWGPSGSFDAFPVSPADKAAYAQWDQPVNIIAPVRNTMWVSIGMTGFAHAPIVQVMVGQQARPQVELLALAATFDRAGVNV